MCLLSFWFCNLIRNFPFCLFPRSSEILWFCFIVIELFSEKAKRMVNAPQMLCGVSTSLIRISFSYDVCWKNDIQNYLTTQSRVWNLYHQDRSTPNFSDNENPLSKDSIDKLFYHLVAKKINGFTLLFPSVLLIKCVNRNSWSYVLF